MFQDLRLKFEIMFMFPANIRTFEPPGISYAVPTPLCLAMRNVSHSEVVNRTFLKFVLIWKIIPSET